jgi:pimeloyl-ACP methyl ester carboxylesterase
MLTDRVRAWRDGGEHVVLNGHRIFVRRRDGAGPPLLLLHGFPSSSYDFKALLDELPGRAAVTFDMLGFGLSDKPRDHDYSLRAQADLAIELAPRDEPVFVVGHDIGTSVANELMARDLDGNLGIRIAGILLLNGSMLQDVASPTLGQRILASRLGPAFARLMSERGFRVQFARIFSDAHPLSDAEAADQWSLLAEAGGPRVLPRTIGYMDERRRLAERWHGAFRDWPGQLSLAWGMRDPVGNPAVLAGLREQRPGVPVRELPEPGHYPQIEDPRAVAAAVEEALRRTA